MSQTRDRIAGLATLASLLLGGPAMAQTVHIFEEAPPLEMLRNIMVPESRPGLTRRIVLGQPTMPAPAQIQAPVSAPAPAPAPAPEAMAAAEPEPERTAEPAPRRPRRPAPAAVLAANGNTLPIPAPAQPQAEAPGTIGYRINFALNSDAIPASAQGFLDRLGELMREQPQVKLQVEGHTDALGPDEYNLQLSQRRAASVANYLMQRHGVELPRLVVLGLGEGQPLYENGYDPRNRRVQFVRVD
ncbi:OmpA family protein [Paracraurococcus lichenis]|uniref:OmpA family protein n=1 Tax=Paracraurococcus lichenis TaxID=3064888 RepID=A0ABT9DW62_9PROT|nr:OmpA family protein [Paracraurococcus sp. LOR1-02]MDO9708136.1 OmpA family protein [Paracraurococcus sp. LOR1-02]